jgi:hypothetical protein
MVKHLNQLDLSRRWALSPRTLERWRWLGVGPRFLKVGKRVVYPLAEVEAFEAVRLHDRTVEPGKAGAAAPDAG